MEAIGKIERMPLRDVWKHEATMLSVWLESNIDVINSVLGLDLSNVEREKSLGDFNVDLTAEDKDGKLVVIENQLAKTDHEHLGKVMTYLASAGAKAAIWIVADHRPEHVQAVAWLNQSGLADFYLVKIEAIRIGESVPAPLLTLITGPSEEALQVGRTKKEFSERHALRREWWSQLLERARSKTKLHANISPSDESWIGTGAGKSGLVYNYVVGQHSARIELYIDRGPDKGFENELIFDRLYEHRSEIEDVFGGKLSWDKMEQKRGCRIAKYYETGGYRDDKEQWPAIQDELIGGMKRFAEAFSTFIKHIDPGSQTSTSAPLQ